MTRTNKSVNTNQQVEPTESGKTVIHPGFVWPLDLWNEVRKAAIDMGVNPKQLVIDLVASHYPVPNGKKH